jgi:hypothetical protein
MPPTRRNISRLLKGCEAQFVLDALGLQVGEKLVAARETLVVLQEVSQTQAAVEAVHLEAPPQGARPLPPSMHSLSVQYVIGR